MQRGSQELTNGNGGSAGYWVAAAAVLVVLVAMLAFTTRVLSPGPLPLPSPALATVEYRSFSAVASASGSLQLISRSRVILRAPFGRADAGRLRAALSGTVTVDALPGVSFPCKVSFIDTSATQVNGVPEYYAEITLTATDLRLRNGQTATANLIVASVNNVLAVPTQSLFTSANGAFQVDVWYQGRPVATTVTVGLTGTTLTQITSGLQQGQQVMLSPVGQTVPSPKASS